jgi:hypothetical protein
MNFGAAPDSASACRVRVEAYVHELATLREEMRTTALMIEGKTLMPAFWMANTKGLAFESTPTASAEVPEPRSCGSVYGTLRPTMSRLMM